MTASPNNYVGAFPCNMGVPPDDDPKTWGFDLTFVANSKQYVDFNDQNMLALINNIQAVYIDNDTASRVIVKVEGGSFHRIIARPNTQGWYPIAMHDGATLSFQSPGAVTASFIFSNVAMCAGPWATT